MENESIPPEERSFTKNETEIQLNEGFSITLQTQKHTHHWLIDEPSGPISMGCCIGCGKEKEFKNWLAETDFITNEEHRTGLGNF